MSKKMGFSSMVNSIKEEANATHKEKHSTSSTHVENVAQKAHEGRFGLTVKDTSKTNEILSVKMTKEIKEAFEAESVITKKKISAIATEVLENIYDASTNTFNVNIPVNPIVEKVDTTLNLPKHLKSALVDGAKAHNMKVYEYFNKIIETLLDK